jgi:FAD/FMN-containing dehydrogenase
VAVTLMDGAINTGAFKAFEEIVGAGNVCNDKATCALMSEDIWARGAPCAFVVAPSSVDELSRCVAAASAQDVIIVPRGGGMSYTTGYTLPASGAVVIDTRRLDKIEIDAPNRIVTVGAGVTWARLNAALKPLRLKTPFWGPLSGIASTLGGGVSQNNAFFGAGHHGPVAESVVGVTMVLADGRVLRTGAASKSGAPPFFRHDGPDLTGMFLGDCGAFGVKAEVTLRLMPTPEHEGWASFMFQDRADCANAMADIARAGLASELFGFDPDLARLRMKRASLMADVSALANVVSSQKSILSGVAEGTRIALAGRSFLDDGAYSLHAVAEGRTHVGVDADIDAMRDIVKRHNGVETENTIPKVVRAQPFTPLNNILGPGGERWAPVHGIVRMADAIAVWAALDELFAQLKPRFEALGVTTGYLVTTLSTNGFLIEPVFYWPEERFALHEATVESGMLKKLPHHQRNDTATAVVREARAAVIEVFTRFGAAHFQIGRTYPFAQTRSPEALAILRAFKRAVDPDSLVNPGVLGL